MCGQSYVFSPRRDKVGAFLCRVRGSRRAGAQENRSYMRGTVRRWGFAFGLGGGLLANAGRGVDGRGIGAGKRGSRRVGAQENRSHMRGTVRAVGLCLQARRGPTCQRGRSVPTAGTRRRKAGELRRKAGGAGRRGTKKPLAHAGHGASGGIWSPLHGGGAQVEQGDRFRA